MKPPSTVRAPLLCVAALAWMMLAGCGNQDKPFAPHAPEAQPAAPESTASGDAAAKETWEEWWERSRIRPGAAPAKPVPAPLESPDVYIVRPVREPTPMSILLCSVLLFLGAAALMVWVRSNGRDRPAGVRWLDASVAFAAASVAVPLLRDLLWDLDVLQGTSFHWAVAAGPVMTVLGGIALYLGARKL